MPQVTLIPSGQSFIAERDEPVLAAALRAGLNLPHSCKGGHCSSCRARVLHGSFDYPGEMPPGLTEATCTPDLKPSRLGWTRLSSPTPITG
jgi:CDP-4-dehydro-6-deoxyglucose reductase